ncbi:MAG: CRISPR-associated endonuclease Cas2 [Minisyncoccia bacterium]
MKKETKIMIGKIILSTIAVAGVLAVAAVAPNALRAIDLFRDKDKRKYHMGSYINRSIAKLKNRGLITFEKKGGKTFVRLTEKGERELLKYQLREMTIQRPKKWDKKWRVIIFDIKEKRKVIRERLRQELKNLGFIKLQNSVWVFPFECEEVIILLKSYFCIGKDVLYMTVEKIENDKWLKEKFGLK